MRPLPTHPALLVTLAVGIGASALLSSGCGDFARVEPPAAAPPPAQPFLGLPSTAYEAMPALLSQTGVFSDIAALTPTAGLLPYEVNAPLWTDGARKHRWLLVPHQVGKLDERGRSDDSGTISFSRYGEWYFPSGTVAVKQFDLPVDERDPSIVRRLETRILIRGLDGQVYGASYRWRADQRDAELQSDARQEDIPMVAADGSSRSQHWSYPGRADCLTCHNRTAGGLLGVNTRQLNRPGHDGVNQLISWNTKGLFDPPVETAQVSDMPHLPAYDDQRVAVVDRVRSYLDANCSHCHQPGAMAFASYDARFETPLEQQNLIYARPVNDYGIDRVRYVKPNDPWRSMLLVRLQKTDSMKMPPLGRNVVDQRAVNLLHTWISSMEGPRALPPPQITLIGDPAQGPVEIRVQHSDSAAELHYTLDGTVPDDSSPRYTAPLHLTAPATLRIKAIRDGFASSVAVPTVISR
jgi:uncharacterized repeat protein (TIGR03806 family)